MSNAAASALYRNPADLAVTTPPLGRVLVVGSCLLAALPEVAVRLTPSCKVEHVLTNNVATLPDLSAKELDDVAFQVVQIPMRSIMPDGSYFRLSHASEAPFRVLLDETKQRLSLALDSVLTYAPKYNILTFVSNFLVPQVNPMGRLLRRNDLRNPIYLFQEINRFLDEEIANRQSCYVLDVDSIASSLGKQFIQDDSLWQINHASALSDADVEGDTRRLGDVVKPSQLYSLKTYDFVAAMWYECLAMHRVAVKIDTVKLVIVDLDDTLWRGVLAEEGPNSIEGWPLGVAEALLYLRQRGVVLAIASKNDPSFIEQKFDTIFGSTRLRLADFALKQIGWNSKIESIGEIIRKVNVLPNSVVFVDDNPVERASAQEAYPGIRVLGGSLYTIRRALLWAAETQVPFITDESSRRSEMITAQAERETQRATLSKEEFLQRLDVVVTGIEVTDRSHQSFNRVSELVNKSNQFNTTGQRWSVQDWDAAFATGVRGYCFEVRDKFTEYGLVVVAIVESGTIQQFVMSCRVIGLGVEAAALFQIARFVAARGYRSLTGVVIPTAANGLGQSLYPNAGFTAAGEGRWSMSVAAAKCPDHVRCEPLRLSNGVSAKSDGVAVAGGQPIAFGAVAASQIG
jgi:FkbH-like protein